MRCGVSGEVTVLGQGECEVKVLWCGKDAQVGEGRVKRGCSGEMRCMW